MMTPFSFNDNDTWHLMPTRGAVGASLGFPTRP